MGWKNIQLQNVFSSEVSISDNTLCFRLLGGYGMQLHVHAFKLFCLLVCLMTRFTKLPERLFHSYSVQMGPSCHNRGKCPVFSRGDFVSIGTISNLAGMNQELSWPCSFHLFCDYRINSFLYFAILG